MQMAFMLFERILSLFIIMLLGFVLVRCGLIKAEDSRSFSLLSLYVVCPLAVINGFKVACTPELLRGILLVLGFTLLSQLIFMSVAAALKRPLKLTSIEQASVIYPNAGILTLPLVMSLLGSEWVIYICANNALLLVFMWTHAKRLISGEKQVDIKKLLLNPNIIAAALGMLILFTGLRFPAPIDSAISSLASMVGPVGMLVTGMLIGGMSLKKVFSFKRGWLVVFLRLIVLPLIITLIAKYSPLASIVGDGETILLVTLISFSGPCGNTIMQMSQLYNSHETAEYASAMNVTSMLCCAVTIPLMAALYYA